MVKWLQQSTAFCFKQLVIDSLPLTGRYFCKQISPLYLDNRVVQRRNEVRWRLGKETSLAPPCSNLRSFGSKFIVLKKVFMTLLWLFGPRQWFGARRSVPRCHPSLRLWCYSIKIGKFSENKQIFKSERHELLFHEHLQFSSTILHGSCTDCQQRLLLAFHLSSCSFCFASMPAPRVLFGVDACLFF